MTVAVTGIGLRSALGDLSHSWQALLQGQSGIRLAQPFPAFPPLPLGLIHAQPSTLADLVPAIALEALADAGLEAKTENWGVVVGSSRACQGQWEHWVQHPEGLNAEHQPEHPGEQWLASLPHQAALLASQVLPQVAVIQSPMAACATGLWAIAQGCELIRSGMCQQVLAGAVEAPVTPLTLAGFQQMGALAATGCYPFSEEREGLVLGEGGVLFVLESLAQAQTRQVPIYGVISGWGFTCDAYHVSAPAPDNHSAILAVKQAIARSGLATDPIDLIHAHGTATQLNDQREAQLIQSLFPASVRIMATKGATGHTLGASGVLGMAFSLLALKDQQLPPVVGLKTPAFPLNFAVPKSPLSLRHALCVSFGFGGQNAAVMLSQVIHENNCG